MKQHEAHLDGSHEDSDSGSHHDDHDKYGGHGITKKELKKAFDHINTNGDKIIAWPEFKKAIEVVVEQAGHELEDGDYDTLKVLFTKIAEQDGKNIGITRKEWKQAIDFLFPMLDVNKSGDVDFCEAEAGFRIVQAYESGLEEGAEKCGKKK